MRPKYRYPLAAMTFNGHNLSRAHARVHRHANKSVSEAGCAYKIVSHFGALSTVARSHSCSRPALLNQPSIYTTGHEKSPMNAALGL